MLLSRFSGIWLCDPIDGRPPGSPIPGILQARTLEWVAISFSSAWKWKVKVKSLSSVRLFSTPWTAAYQAPPSMGFSRQEYWSGVPLPSSTSGLPHTKQLLHIIYNLSFLHWFLMPVLSYGIFPYVCDLFLDSILFHFYICIFLCQCNRILISMMLQKILLTYGQIPTPHSSKLSWILLDMF